MSEGKERAGARLANLEAIEPLLGSLRVLSLSTMQMALNRQQSLTTYANRFSLLAAQVHSLAGKKREQPEVEEDFGYKRKPRSHVLAVIGSSRGICGQYNKQLARLAAEHIAAEEKSPIKVLAFGSRVQRALIQEGVGFEGWETLAHGSMPDYDLAAKLMRGWEVGQRAGTLERVDILSFKKSSKSNSYHPVFTPLMPTNSTDFPEADTGDLPWPPPIIEGDPQRMLEQIDTHLLAIRFYQLILDAIAAENLYRFRLLEEAKENTSALLEELQLAIKSEHRKEITQQLQELLVGSGMLAQR